MFFLQKIRNNSFLKKYFNFNFSTKILIKTLKNLFIFLGRLKMAFRPLFIARLSSPCQSRPVYTTRTVQFN
jgi:hypothetical protein